jgi:hypothetical protein
MLSRLTSRDRRLVWLLAAVGALTRLVFAFRGAALLATRPYIEDAFYAFSCARHLALGHGFSVDGVHPTNGVQPLICLLYAPFFWLTPDRWTALALTFLLEAALQIAGTILLAELLSRIAIVRDEEKRRYSPPVIGAIIWTFSQQLLIHNTNGLETGLVAVLLMAATLALIPAMTLSRAIGVGILCGLLVLARIDTAVFVAVMCVWLLARDRRRWWHAVVVGLIAVLISAPWFLYGYRTFGSIMPISGQSEGSHALLASTILSNAWEAIVALADIVSVAFYHQISAVPQWMNVLWVVLIVFVLLVAVSRYELGRRLRERSSQSALAPLAIFGLFVTIYYTFLFGAPHFLSRYLHPVRVLWIVEASLVAPFVLERVWRGSKSVKLLAIVVAIVALAFNVERYTNNYTTSKVSELYSAGVWAEAHAPDKIGMEQSGTSGFVADNVVNLDGKVNADALRSRQRGEMGQYIRAMDFHYLMDWPDLLAPTLESARAAGLQFDPIDSIGRVTIYERH